MSDSTPGRGPDATDDELLSALERATDPVESPVASAADVAEHVPINADSVRKRMPALVEGGTVNTRKYGRSRTYWVVPGEGDRQPRLDELDQEAEQRDGPNVVESDQGESVPVDQLVADLWTWLEGRPPKKSHGRQAVADVFRRLLEESGRFVETAELKSVVYRGDRRERWSSKRAAWESVRRYLSDLPGVESSGAGEWSVDVDAAGREVSR